MTVETVPSPPLVVSQAALALSILVELLDGPAAFRQGRQPLQGSLSAKRAVVIVEFLLFLPRFWQRSLTDQPALSCRENPLVCRTVALASRRPMRPERHHLLA